MKKTDNLMNDSKKRLVVRFIYRNPATPSCDVIELDQEQWNEFMRSQSMTNRINMLLELMDKEYMAETQNDFRKAKIAHFTITYKT